jgi:hypothetical protein
MTREPRGKDARLPIAQIVATGNISIPSAFNGGAVTILPFGTGPIYNVLGGPVNVDPGAFLDYVNNSIHVVPEPSALLLVLIGSLLAAIAVR